MEITNARLRRLRSVVISWWADCHPDERGFQSVLTVAIKTLNLKNQG